MGLPELLFLLIFVGVVFVLPIWLVVKAVKRTSARRH